MLCSCIVNLALFLATLLSPTFGRVTDVDVFTRETTAYGNSSKLVDLAYRSMSAIPVQYPVNFALSDLKFKSKITTIKSIDGLKKHCTQFPDSRLRGVIRVDGLGHSLLEMINCMMVSRALEKENLCSQLIIPFHAAFRSLLVIAPFHPIPSVKFEGRPNHQIYCHGKDHAAWMQYQYQRPATLVKSETWPKTLRCSILNDDPWHQFCKISSWCNESLAEQMAKKPATAYTYAKCGELSSSKSGFNLSTSELLSITSEIRQLIVQEHVDRVSHNFGKARDPRLRLHHEYVDECGFSAKILNIVFHIRRGDVYAHERSGATSMRYFSSILQHLRAVLSDSVPFRFIVFTEASWKPFTNASSKDIVLPEFPGLSFEVTPFPLMTGGLLFTAYQNAGNENKTHKDVVYFRLNANPWEDMKCMSRADVFIGSPSSFSMLAALLVDGPRVLSRQIPFVRDQCDRLSQFCDDELTDPREFFRWKRSSFEELLNRKLAKFHK